MKFIFYDSGLNKELKSMPLIKVKRHCQITLPSLIRKKFNIGEGDYLEIKEEGNAIILKPVKVVDVEESSLNNSRES